MAAALSAAEPSVEPELRPNEKGFRRSVAPFLNTLCLKCHGEQKQEAMLSLHAVASNLLAGQDLDTWQLVADRRIARLSAR